jgi:hypothetical protein
MQEPMAMASMERTAYPRFQPIPHARELTEYFTPTAEEMAFGPFETNSILRPTASEINMSKP